MTMSHQRIAVTAVAMPEAIHAAPMEVNAVAVALEVVALVADLEVLEEVVLVEEVVVAVEATVVVLEPDVVVVVDMAQSLNKSAPKKMWNTQLSTKTTRRRKSTKKESDLLR